MTLDEVISYNRLFADMETKSGDLEIAEYYRDTVKCLEELKELREQISEYKRLLKAAVEDMNKEADCGICLHDNDGECPIEVASCKFKWRYADEALALIGGETDEQI